MNSTQNTDSDPKSVMDEMVERLIEVAPEDSSQAAEDLAEQLESDLDAQDSNDGS